MPDGMQNAGKERGRVLTPAFTLARRLLSREFAAEYLGMGLSTFDREVKEGRLPKSFRPTEGLIRWDVRDLDGWIEAEKERQLAAPGSDWDDA